MIQTVKYFSVIIIIGTLCILSRLMHIGGESSWIPRNAVSHKMVTWNSQWLKSKQRKLCTVDAVDTLEPLLIKVTKEPRLADSITTPIFTLLSQEQESVVHHILVFTLSDKARPMAKPNSKLKCNPTLWCAESEWHQNIWIAVMTQISPKRVFVTVVIKYCYLRPFDPVLHCYSWNQDISVIWPILPPY